MGSVFGGKRNLEMMIEGKRMEKRMIRGKRRGKVARVVVVISLGPPLGVDPVGKMRLRIPNKQTNKQKSYN